MSSIRFRIFAALAVLLAAIWLTYDQGATAPSRNTADAHSPSDCTHCQEQHQHPSPRKLYEPSAELVRAADASVKWRATKKPAAKSLAVFASIEHDYAPWQGYDEFAFRARAVQLAPELLTGQPLPRDTRLELPLFDDLVLSAVVANSFINVNRTVSTRAIVEDTEWSRAVFAYTQGELQARILHPESGRTFGIEYNHADGLHYLLEFDPAKLAADQTCGVDHNTPLALPPETTIAIADPAGTVSDEIHFLDDTALADESVAAAVIDVLAVYSENALAQAGSVASMDNTIALGISLANDAHSNTDTGIYIQLIHSELLSGYTSSNSNATELTAVRNHTGGYSNVGNLRDAYGADFVTAITTVGGGIANLLNSSSGRPSGAFSATGRSSYASYTVAHEVGHNMGLSHAADQNFQSGPTGGSIGNDAAGWHWHPTQGARGYCTVLTYTGASYFADGLSHARVGLFSDPAITHMGKAAGNVASANNARVLRQLRDVYAAYRTRATNPSPGVEVDTPSGGESWARGSTQIITWESNGITGNVKIELYKNDAFHSTIDANTFNDRIYYWAVPAALTSSNTYTVRISSVSTPAVDGVSAAPFIITEVIYETDLDTNPGFTPTGDWAYGSPTSGNSNGGPTSAFTGTSIYDTKLNGNAFASSSLLTAGPFDCRHFADVSLQFAGQFSVAGGYTARVQVSRNGTNWTTVETKSGNYEGSWSIRNIDISAVADDQQTVYLRWSHTGSGGNYSGMAVDDVVLSGRLARSINYAETTFHEALTNDGAIADPILITLVGDTFTGNNNEDFAGTKATVTKVPAGLTARLTRISSTELGFSLAGNAAQHESINDISNLTVVFANSAFTDGSAATVPGSSFNSIAVDFEDARSFVLSVTPNSISEAGGSATVTLTRNDTDGPLSVTLASSDTSEATVPARINMGDGVATTSFTVTAVDDSIPDGTQTALISASAPLYVTQSIGILVTDEELLGISLASGSISEFNGSTTGTVTRPGATGGITILLNSNDISEATVPTAVTIPNGANSANFTVNAVDDNILDGAQNLNITANANGYTPNSAPLRVTDYEPLTLSAPSPISENGGSVTITLSRSNTTGNTTVSLASSDTSEATVPNSIVIPNGASSVTVPITAVDDALLDGNKSVIISASASGWIIGSTTLIVTDHEELALSIADSAISENGGSSILTVTRTDTSSNLDVSFATSDNTEATAVGFTILAGKASGTGTLTAVDDDLIDGTQTVTFAASASGYLNATDTIDITDHETLGISLADSAISEFGGSTIATLTRIDTSGDLVVTLLSSDISEATVPPSLTIPNAQGSATFAISAVDDALVDGTQPVVITASATAYADSTASLDVEDYELLGISISEAQIPENGGSSSGVITRTDTSGNLSVFIASSDTGEANHVSLTILDGNASASFTLTAVDDDVIDGTQPVTMSASATGYQGASDSIDIVDHETLALSFSPRFINENAGPVAATATLTRSATNGAVTVTLASGDTSELTVPISVALADGAGSTNFPIDAIDDLLADGDQVVSITASTAGYEDGINTITVTDDETLQLTIAAPSIAENAGLAATFGTVTRTSLDLSAPVPVTIASDDNGEATPATASVTILAGQSSANFDIDAVDDNLLDGLQTATFSASAPGFAPGSASVDITDYEALLLSIAADLNEDGGSTTGTVTRTNADQTGPLSITLTNPDQTEISIPVSVTILANNASANFSINAVDDTLLDGTQTVAITASTAGFVAATTSLDVADDVVTIDVVATPAEGGSVTGDITADPDAGPFAISATPNPSHVFTAWTSTHGSIANNQLDNIPANANVTVSANFNARPVVTSSSLSTPEDTPLLGTALITDAEGDAFQAILVSSPLRGSLTLLSTGAFTYSPKPHYFGSDSFAFRANDGADSASNATVNISVASVNDPPVLTSPSFTAAEDSSVTIHLAPYASDVEGSPISFDLGSPFTYTPPANANGPVTFEFIASDGEDTSVGTATVHVTPINDPPVNTSPPTIVGTLRVGETLNATVGGWNDNIDITPGNLRYTYQWRRGPAVLSTAPTYSIPVSDRGKQLTLRIIAIDDGEGIPGQATTADSATLTVENTPPVITAFSLTLNEDEPASFTPNTSDADGDPIALTLFSQPSHGSAGISGYTPHANFAGSDSFVLRADDGQGGITDYTVPVTVIPVPDRPIALSASFTTAEDSPLPIDLSSYVSDDDGDSLTLSTGVSFTYTPTAHFHGVDSIPYTVSDGTGLTATATVTITVTSVNDVPIITPFTITTNEDTPVALNPTVTDADGDTLSISPLSYSPPSNFHGSDSLELTASDGTVTSRFTVLITVISVNDPPVAVGFRRFTLLEDGRLDFSLNIVDLDGDSVTTSLLSTPAHGTGTLTSYVPAANYHGSDSYSIQLDDGKDRTLVPVILKIKPVNDLPVIAPFSLTTDEDTPINFTPTATDIDGDAVTFSQSSYSPPLDFHGADSFTLIASDGSGTSTYTVQVTVNSVNDPPVITPFSLTTDEDIPINFSPTVTDADGDSISLSQTSYTPPANFHGSDSFVLIANDGSATTTATVWVTVNSLNDLPIIAPFSLTTDEDTPINFTPAATDADGDAVTFNRSSYSPPANFHGADSFELIASDGIGTSSFTVQITVNSVNDLPVITPFTLSTDEDTPINFAPQASDADGDSVTFSPTSYTPAQNLFGDDSFEVIADDGNGTSSLTVQVTVNPINDAPVITPFSLTTDEDITINFNPTVTDAEDDSVTLSQTSYTPAENFAGDDSFVLIADDGSNSSSITVNVTVLPVNDPPDNSNLPTIAGQPLVGTTLVAASGTWSDVEGETLNFAYEWRRNGSAIASGSSYTVVTADNTAAISVAVTANDGVKSAVAESAILSIQNRAPTIPALSLTVLEDGNVSFDHLASDPDGDSFTVELLSPADEGVATTSTYTPSPNYHGIDAFTIRATDAHGLASTRVIAVTVIPTNDPPVVTSGTPQFIGVEDTPFDINLTPFASDIDRDTLSFSTGPIFTYTPPADFQGLQTLDIVVSDGSVTATFTINIFLTSVNDVPVISPFTFTAQEDIATNYTIPATDVDGDSLTLSIVRGAVHGVATTTTYTPSPGFFGNDRFTIRADDGQGGVANREIHVVIQAVNDLPEANADFANVQEEGSVLIPVLDNDSDFEGDPLSVLAVTGTHTEIEGDAIRYSPPLDFFGTVNFTYTLSDGGGTSIGSVVVNVVPVNDPPVIGSLSLTLAEDSFADFALATSDVDGDDVLVTVFRNPAHGNASITRYTPAPDFYGADSFSLRWDDHHGSTGIAVVPVVVTPKNDPPVANSATFSTLEDTTLPIDLTTIASDLDGDPLSFSVGPVFDYTPAANVSGSDNFSFVVSDGTATATATVVIEIIEVNDPPVIRPFSLTTDEDSPIDFTPTATDIDGDHVTLSPTTYTPPADFNGSDSFDVVADDGRGGTDRFTVVVSVTPGNDLPTITPFSLTTDEDTPIDFTADTNDIDGDTVTVSPNSYTPALDFFGNDSFEIIIDDGTASITFTVRVTVNPVNDPPLNTVPPSILGTALVGESLNATPGTWTDAEDDPLSFSYAWLRNGEQIATGASYTVVNADNDSSLSLTVTTTDGEFSFSANSASVSVNNRAPVIPALTLTVDEDGNVDFDHQISDPDGDALTISVSVDADHGVASTSSYSPLADYYGTDSFTLHAVDSFGAESSLLVPINVVSVNDPPLANSASFTTDEDIPLVIDLTPLASDIDSSISFSIGPVFTYTPVADFAGSDVFTFTVDDGDATASATVHITINPVDDPPTAKDDSFTGLEDDALIGNFLANDLDPEGSFLAVTSWTQPTNGSVHVSGNGAFSYQPAANWSGTDSFIYTMMDSSFTPSTATVSLQILPVNDAPINIDPPSIVGDAHVGATLTAQVGLWEDLEGQPISYSYEWHRNGAAIATGSSYELVTADNTADISVLVSGSDGDDSRTVESSTLTVLNRPPVIAAIAFSVDEDDQAIIAPAFSDPDGDTVLVTVGTPAHGTGTALSYSPEPNYHGSDSYVFIATDSYGASSSNTASITILPVNDAPVTQDDSATTLEDGIIVIAVLANDDDIDGDTLTLLATDSAQFDIATQRYTPVADFHGTEEFTYTVSDGSVTRTATVRVTTLPQNDAPVVMDETVTVLEDGSVSVDLLANDSDPDGDELTVVGLPTVDGVFSYTPPADAVSPVSFTYRVSDGQAQRIATVNIEIIAENDAPIAIADSATTDEDVPVVLDLLGNDTDVDGDALQLLSVSTPHHDGTHYTPPANFYGSETFTYSMSDGFVTVTGTATVVVRPVNDGPVITPFSLTTDEDTLVSFAPQVDDPEGDAVAVDISSYTPAADFHGTDSFVITASDGSATTTFTVHVTVNAVNDPPVITAFSLQTDEDTPIDFSADTDDIDGDVVTVNLNRYTPAPNFYGTDSFELIANDGAATSTFTVHVTVKPVNDLPIITPFSLTTDEDTPISFTASVNDLDGDTVSVTPTTYTPPADFFGSDSFELIANDGTGTSSLTVTVTINPVNDPPVILPFSLTTDEDTSIQFTAPTFDVDGDTVTVNLSSYTPPADFYGNDSFEVIASDGSTSTAFTVTVSVLPENDPPQNNSLPSIEGTAVVGHTVNANPGTWTDIEQAQLSFSYQWQRDAADIDNATSSSYLIAPEDVDSALSVVVTANDAQHSIPLSSVSRRVGWEVRIAALSFGMSDSDISTPTTGVRIDLLGSNQSYSDHFQPFADSATWILHTNRDTQLALDWTSTALPSSRYLSLYEIHGPDDHTPTGARASHIDANGTVFIPAGERWFLIRYESMLSEIFVFHDGWNLISLPFLPLETAGLGPLWAEIGSVLTPADIPQAYRGYWTWQPKACVCRIGGLPISPVALEIAPGSNSIGVDRERIPNWDLEGPILRYSRDGYREATVLQPRVGYIIFSATSQTLD